MTNENLIDFILGEAERFRQQQCSALQEFRNELSALQSKRSQMEGNARALSDATSQIENQRSEVQHEVARIDQQLAEKKIAKDDATGNLAHMNKLLLSMNEARAKFAKNCDKKSLETIKAAAAGSKTGMEILNKICVFITGSMDASYSVQGVDIFASPDSLTTAVKRCDPSALEK